MVRPAMLADGVGGKGRESCLIALLFALIVLSSQASFRCRLPKPCHSISLNIHEHPCKPQRRVERCPALLRGLASVAGVPFQLLLSPVPPPSAVPGCLQSVGRHHPPTF